MNQKSEEFNWHDGLSVGVRELDEQHKHLFSIISKLAAKTDAIVSDEIVDEVLNEMREYADVHFALEESMMLRASYTETEEHRKRHFEFKQTMVRFCFDVASHKRDTPETIRSYLNEWWTKHIIEEDQAYSETLIKHGLK